MLASCYSYQSSFNPRICKRCDSIAPANPNPAATSSFNPRICKRCDDSLLPKWLTYRVSIHASVKDATKKWAEAYAHVRVSIHASVKDATFVDAMAKYCTYEFQSTHL